MAYERRAPSRQSGVALVTALLILAIASLAAAEMLASQHLDIRRSQNILARDQAWVYALAAEQTATELLAADRADNDHDGMDDAWAGELSPFEQEEASIRLTIRDLQGRLNLNNLAVATPGRQEIVMEQLRRLLRQRHPEYGTGVEAAVADWVDSDLEPRFPGGAEDDIYTRKEPPYRPGNRPMQSPSELRLVHGMTPETFEAVRPFVTALPATDLALNVNTAPPEVLRTLADGISERAAKTAAEAARDAPWEDVQAFMQEQPEFAEADIDPTWLTVRSEYFLVHGQVRLDRARVDLYSVLHRPRDGPIRVLYRSRTRP